MMTAVLAELGLDASYLAWRVPESALCAAVKGLRTLGALGCNVTVPHKRGVLRCGVRACGAAEHLGAVNTLLFRGDEVEGHNTDVRGAREALREGGAAPRGEEAVVLGAGGAARAVIAALAEEGARTVTVVARSLSEARAAAHVGALCSPVVGFEALGWNDDGAVTKALSRAAVVAQSTSLGMAGGPEGEVPLRWLDALPAGSCAFDLVYAPERTPFLAHAEARGLRAIGGLGMLAWQAAAALELWFERPVEGELLLRALRGASLSAPAR